MLPVKQKCQGNILHIVTILEDIPCVLEAFSASQSIVSNPVFLCAVKNPATPTVCFLWEGNHFCSS